MSHIHTFLEELEACKQDHRIPGAQKFFKTGKGEYGEGDLFWGINVPTQRSIAKKYYKLLSIDDAEYLLQNEIHEVRLTTLMIMVLTYQKSKDRSVKQNVVDLYLRNPDRINNWDLVDSSAHYILGDWCLSHGWDVLKEWAKSNHLWKQRIAMISCFAFIRSGNPEPCLVIAELLVNHPHDLIHKAVGWMLRELGDRDPQAEMNFLKQHYRKMPRTMLRYAIEKYPEELRQDFLKGRI